MIAITISVSITIIVSIISITVSYTITISIIGITIGISICFSIIFITVCDTAAAEECPPWPGQPITGHWGLPDPVKVQGTDAEKALAFAQTYAEMRRRIAAFVALPLASLDRLALQTSVDALSQD